MDYTEADIAFQNAPDTLRCVPWVDVPALRKACQEELRRLMSTERWQVCLPEFLDDVEEFCDGKRSRVPRASRCAIVVNDTITKLFPASRTDQKLRRGRNRIYAYILQIDSWALYSRGEE